MKINLIFAVKTKDEGMLLQDHTFFYKRVIISAVSGDKPGFGLELQPLEFSRFK